MNPITYSLLLMSLITLSCSPTNFGRIPQGARKEKILKSPNYRDGRFQNLSKTQQITADSGKFSMIAEFLFKKQDHLRPDSAIPAIKTDILNLNPSEDVLVWFGHSSYYMQLAGTRILVDPVFSKAASPVSFFNKPFKGTNIYTADDMPEIDYLVITHDHWDHLDYSTVKALKSKVKKIVCPLGVGEHFERWKFDMSSVLEMDWNDIALFDSGVEFTCLPARHFSGRGLSPNQSLWASFLLKTPTSKIFIGGDSGYDTHFADIGNRFGPIDFAILEDGQYGRNWKYIHMTPEQTLQAAADLKAKVLLPVHNSKFALSVHSWDEPLSRVAVGYTGDNFKLITPMIGEQVALQDTIFAFKHWWKK